MEGPPPSPDSITGSVAVGRSRLEVYASLGTASSSWDQGKNGDLRLLAMALAEGWEERSASSRLLPHLVLRLTKRPRWSSLTARRWSKATPIWKDLPGRTGRAGEAPWT
jgi:hypothetical protein